MQPLSLSPTGPWNDAKRESIITFATLEQGLADMTNLLSWTPSQMSDVTRNPYGTTLPPRAWDPLPRFVPPTAMLADQHGGVNRWASGEFGEDRPPVALAPPVASVVCGRTRRR